MRETTDKLYKSISQDAGTNKNEMERGSMRGYHVLTAVCLVVLGVLIGSCSKDQGTSAPTPTVPSATLTANPPGVTLVGTTPQNVTITAGLHPYTIAQQPSPNLATAQFVNANLDTAVLVITGVSTATGSTSVVVRDASTLQRSVVVGIVKAQ